VVLEEAVLELAPELLVLAEWVVLLICVRVQYGAGVRLGAFSSVNHSWPALSRNGLASRIVRNTPCGKKSSMIRCGNG
jgi:hypothetical protein